MNLNSLFADGGKDVSYFDRVFERAAAVNATVVSNAVNVINSIDVFKSNLNFWRFGRGENLNKEEVGKKNEKNLKDEREVDYEREESKTENKKENIDKESEDGKKVEEDLDNLDKILSEKERSSHDLQNKNNATPTATIANLNDPNQNQAPIPPQNPLQQLLRSLLGGGQGSQGGQGVGNNQNGLEQYTGGPFAGGIPAGPAPQQLATPYNGPGGSIPGECEIPEGPIAYNIGGNNVTCFAESVVIGFLGSPRNVKYGRKKVYNMGYINPLVEKSYVGQFSPGVLYSSLQSGAYGEPRFRDYNSPEATSYLNKQILHWKAVGKAVGQKCIPVDIDNCDSIGNAAYLSILNRIEEQNKTGDVVVKVLTKNPHNNCNFMSHPAVIGAFVEISGDEPVSVVRKVAATRNKPEQILIFARGGPGTNDKVLTANKQGLPNSAYSYDEGGEYKNVVNCTYNP